MIDRQLAHPRLVAWIRRSSAGSGLPVTLLWVASAPANPLGLEHPREHPNTHQASSSALLLTSVEEFELFEVDGLVAGSAAAGPTA